MTKQPPVNETDVRKRILNTYGHCKKEDLKCVRDILEKESTSALKKLVKPIGRKRDRYEEVKMKTARNILYERNIVSEREDSEKCQVSCWCF